MPIVEYPAFDKYKNQGFKGVFVGGCIERGEGSSFRAKAHAHCCPNSKGQQDEYFGWICVRSAKRLYRLNGRPSMLMLHELAHILTPFHWHDDAWRKKVRELGGHVGKQYQKIKRSKIKEGNITQR